MTAKAHRQAYVFHIKVELPISVVAFHQRDAKAKVTAFLDGLWKVLQATAGPAFELAPGGSAQVTGREPLVEDP